MSANVSVLSYPHALRGLVPAPWRRNPPTRRLRGLLALFTLCLVIPVLEVPGWGISLSTPIFCFLAIELALGSDDHPDLRPYTKWILLAGLFWMGQFLSIAGNVFAGKLLEVSWLDVLHLVQMAYWMSVFVVTTVMVSRFELGPWLCRFLAVSLAALSTMRLLEAFGLDTWGYAKALLHSPNGYGRIFSTFTPFLAWLVFTERGWRRLLYGVGLSTALLAIAGNGSRSSWVAVAIGLLLLTLLFSATQLRAGRRITSMIIAAMALGMLVFALIPQPVRQPVIDRFSSFQHLESDKPLAIRVLMIQKATSLFAENPVFGVGTGHFRLASAHLTLPPLLNYQSQAYFNEKSAHNSYACLVAESGLLGAFPFALLILLLGVRGVGAVWRSARRGDGWTVPVYVAFVAMSIHFWTLTGLTGATPWFVYGLLAAVVHRDVHRPQSS